MPDGGNAPSWLFSFVDLAFLLMIAMTQLVQDAPGPDLGDIIVPRIQESATAPTSAEKDPPWQLRVHPPDSAGAEPPFELVRGASDEIGEAPPRLTLAELHARLAQVKMSGQTRPLLAPHEDSRSQDMLDALTLLEELWPSLRRVSVRPLPSGL